MLPSYVLFEVACFAWFVCLVFAAVLIAVVPSNVNIMNVLFVSFGSFACFAL